MAIDPTAPHGDAGDSSPVLALGEAAANLHYAANDLQGSAHELNAAAAALTFAARSGGGQGGGQGGNIGAARAGIGAAGQALGGTAGTGGAAAGLAGSLWSVGKIALGVAQNLNQLSQESINYARTLSQASASMSAVFAERNFRELLRNMEKGERLAPAARGLVQAEQDVADQTKEMEILWQRARIGVATGWERFKAEALRPLNEMARGIDQMVGNTDPNKGVENVLMGEWVKAVEDQQRQGMERRREHRMPPEKVGPKVPDWLPEPR